MLLPIGDLIGVPFVSKGRSIKGADCWGWVMLVYERLTGKKLPDFGKGCDAFLADIVFKKIDEQVTVGKWEPVGGPELHCVVTIQNHPIFVNHVGICFDTNYFGHTMEKTGSRIDRFDHPLWKNRVRGFYRYAGQ